MGTRTGIGRSHPGWTGPKAITQWRELRRQPSSAALHPPSPTRCRQADGGRHRWRAPTGPDLLTLRPAGCSDEAIPSSSTDGVHRRSVTVTASVSPSVGLPPGHLGDTAGRRVTRRRGTSTADAFQCPPHPLVSASGGVLRRGLRGAGRRVDLAGGRPGRPLVPYRTGVPALDPRPGVAPMLLLGLPHDVLEWATRPAIVDATLVRLRRPPVAIATVTVVLVGSMAPAVVRSRRRRRQCGASVRRHSDRGPGALAPGPRSCPSHSPAEAHGPVRLPGGTGRCSRLSVLCPDPRPASPLCDLLAVRGRHRSPPLNDQQIAGFVSKLAMLIVLLAVGTVYLLRGDEESNADDPLVLG